MLAGYLASMRAGKVLVGNALPNEGGILIFQNFPIRFTLLSGESVRRFVILGFRRCVCG